LESTSRINRARLKELFFAYGESNDAKRHDESLSHPGFRQAKKGGGECVRILITGGSGMVGRYMVDHLVNGFDVEVLDLKPLHRSDVRLHTVDVLDLTSVRKVVEGFDAVVHLAGIPHPLTEPGEKVFRVNVMGTFNLLEACAEHGIAKFILMSSESTLGFAFSSKRLWPLRIPIDESHPLRPHDPYGLSKVVAEQLCVAVSNRTDMKTICLRPPWVWVPEENERTLYRQLLSEYPKWSKNLWSYIIVEDLTRCVRLALDSDHPGKHEAMFVCAADNWTGRESVDLIREFYPETRIVDPTLRGDASFISSAAARRILGFEPTRTWRDILP
jgi:UDP-glucose 4-epimerase